MSEVRIAAPGILSIDDDPGDRRRVVEVLHLATPTARLGVACHASEGLRSPRHQGQYATAPTGDLIVLDLRMPKKNGLEVLAEAKQYPLLKRIPVVVLTGYAAPRVHVFAERNGQKWVFSMHDNRRGWMQSEPGKEVTFRLTVFVSSPNAKV